MRYLVFTAPEGDMTVALAGEFSQSHPKKEVIGACLAELHGFMRDNHVTEIVARANA